MISAGVQMEMTGVIVLLAIGVNILREHGALSFFL
jgi:hypothetical protein